MKAASSFPLLVPFALCALSALPLACGQASSDDTEGDNGGALTGAQPSIPSFPARTPYSTARAKLIDLHWMPFHAKDADECLEGDARCEEHPEMQSCAPTGDAHCSFLWKQGTALISISTIGEPAVVNGVDAVKDDVPGSTVPFLTNGSTPTQTGVIPDSTLATVNVYQVSATQLNCRDTPVTGALIDVVGADQVLTATSKPGKPRIQHPQPDQPWLYVKTPSEKTCYVSAKRQYIEPRP